MSTITTSGTTCLSHQESGWGTAEARQKKVIVVVFAKGIVARRCSNEKLLKISKRNLKLFGQRSFAEFYGTISLEFSAGHSKKCTIAVSVQITAKNLLVCPGLPVQSEERCVCVWQLNVDGCIWIGRGGRGRERA